MTEDDLKFLDGTRAFTEIENSEGFKFFMTVLRATFNVEDLFIAITPLAGRTLGEAYAKADGMHEAASRILSLPKDIHDRELQISTQQTK